MRREKFSFMRITRPLTHLRVRLACCLSHGTFDAGDTVSAF